MHIHLIEIKNCNRDRYTCYEGREVGVMKESQEHFPEEVTFELGFRERGGSYLRIQTWQ